MPEAARLETFQKSLPTLLLCLAILLAYPLLWVFGEAMGIKLFTAATMAALALAFALWQPGRLASALAANGLFPALPIAVMGGIAVYHFALDPRWDFEALCLSLAWIAFPLFAWTSQEQCRKLLPWLLALLWLGTIALSFLDIHFGRELGGLPGNWNWNATQIAIGLPFAAYLSLRLTWSRKWMLLRLAGILAVAAEAAISFHFLRLCDSKGAYIALGAIALLIAILEANAKWRKWVLAGLAAGAFAIVAALILTGAKPLAGTFATDVRLPLWKSSMEMIADHPLLGVGEASFESNFASYRSAAYFSKPNASVRTNHTHNNLLFIACGFGLLGLLAWLTLIIYPLCLFIVSYRSRSLESKLVFYAFFASLAHAQFDLILFEWPTAMCALLLLGLLWAEAWPPGNERPFARLGALKLAGRLASLAIALAACLSAGLCCWSHCLSAKAGTYRPAGDAAAPLAAFYHARASELSKTDPQVLYRGATYAYLHARNRDLCLWQLELLDQTPWWNFAHANGFRAKCLQSKGRNAEALDAILKESANFPLQVIPLQTLATLQAQRGDKEGSKAALAALSAVMQMRGLDMNDLKAILENPDFDLRYKLDKSLLPGAKK